MKTIILDLGNAMRKFREENNLTQDEFAGLVGISAWNVSRLENGHGDPKLSTVTQIRKALEIKLEVFDAGWEGRPLIYSRGWVDVVMFQKLVMLRYSRNIFGKAVFLNLMPANPPGKRVKTQNEAKQGAIMATVTVYPHFTDTWNPGGK